MILVLWVLVEATGQLWRLFAAPWSIGALGQPTLTGTWEGLVRAALGPSCACTWTSTTSSEWLAAGAGSALPAKLQGRGRLCTPRGTTYEYALCDAIWVGINPEVTAA